jgi:delta 1-pyrroline-5-carboxylate dehydrogenase
MTRFSLQDPDLFRRQAYVSGQWCDADNGATLDVNNPATGEILGTVPMMGTAETRRAIEAAKSAWGDWRRRRVVPWWQSPQVLPRFRPWHLRYWQTRWHPARRF